MNLYHNLNHESAEELKQTLHETNAIKIERIVSQGQVTPEGKWYDQDQSEWVTVLQGAATLQFEDDPKPHSLQAGDYLLIPAHTKHRVSWTDPSQPTLWLTIFYSENNS